MTTLVHRYKVLPQVTKNYIQLGAVMTAAGAFYYRNTIRNMYQRRAMGSVQNAKNQADVSQPAK
ncbi:hypothetical protein BKA57DRAFT_533920 [Linnemannia elongata]|nr:hypothetical protein BGZ88_001194 [Linnemannia elongata]KAH7052753.1 hypothetical protein BKA57DRAFT_533920 [Linnemannia elongata]